MNRSFPVIFVVCWLLTAAASVVARTPLLAVPGTTVAISAIQGRGEASPLVGTRVVTTGVVTLVVPRGFFLQDPAGDGDARTSDGLFVFTGWPPKVVAGDAVQVEGDVTEYASGGARGRATGTLTELKSAKVLRTGAGAPVKAVALALPLAHDTDMEALEGMRVVLRGPLAVLEPARSERGGALTVSCGPRLHAPTDQARPGPAAQRHAERNARCRVLVDLSPGPRGSPPSAVTALRAGDPFGDIPGVVGDTPAPGARTRSMARIHPVATWEPPPAPVRPAQPPAVGGDLRVAAVNVQNFFTTLNDGRNVCAPGSPRDCRGARTPEAFERQRDKIVDALVRLDADVVGLMEIENNPRTLDALVAALNQRVGSGRYAAVRDAADTAVSARRGDAIQVAMIYRPRQLRVDGVATRDSAPVHERAPLAQVFRTSAGQRFAVVVSHFKSKRCQNARGADTDQSDDQGCFNARRVGQARALGRFARQLGTGDVLLIGDLNAHAEEDPLHVLRADGFIDELARAGTVASPHYSYVFDGVAGRLDHLLASPSMSRRVTGAAVWHINADELPGAGGPGDAVRSSDHDPVLLGLSFGSAR